MVLPARLVPLLGIVEQQTQQLLGVALGLRSSTSFADAFRVFGEAGFIEADLVARLESMAKFRNVLVHGYTEVDDQRVVEILKTRLGDLDDFRRQIAFAVAE